VILPSAGHAGGTQTGAHGEFAPARVSSHDMICSGENVTAPVPRYTYHDTCRPTFLPTVTRAGGNIARLTVVVVVTLREGTTAEQVIEGEADIDQAVTGFYGALFLEPGGTADLAFESLAPGTYFLVCDVTTEDGTPHYELGMVSQITVE